MFAQHPHVAARDAQGGDGQVYCGGGEGGEEWGGEGRVGEVRDVEERGDGADGEGDGGGGGARVVLNAAAEGDIL